MAAALPRLRPASDPIFSYIQNAKEFRARQDHFQVLVTSAKSMLERQACAKRCEKQRRNSYLINK
jgi:hypothetical protein